MPLNVIKNNMITKNTVELKPTVNYVSASSDCNNLNLHDLTSEGVTGEETAKSIRPNNVTLDKYSGTFESPRVFKINESKFSNNETTLETLNASKDRVTSVLGIGNGSYYFNFLELSGIEKNNSYDYKFGIEKIKQKFLIDDENYYKKKSIKNLYRFYRENIEYRNSNPNWGIGNYNTLNFFNVGTSLNSSFADGKTHKNFLAYPNLRYNNVQAYDFSDENNNGFTFSFYINQKRKNLENSHFNPGCILHIPHMIGIYIVKGTNVDTNGYTDKYRLYIELGDITNDAFDSTGFLRTNISVNISGIADSNRDKLLSSDNLLSYNNWHNVTIHLKYNDTDDYDLIISVDGVKKDEFLNVSVTPANASSESSMIFVGNRPQNLSGNIANYFKKLFSTSLTVDDDTLGPYVNKNIDFGTKFETYDLELTVPDGGFSVDFSGTITDASTAYTDTNTSLALNAEIHDIRIYDAFISDVKELICDNNITDFSNDLLLFSVPVYYYDTPIRKRSIVNLYGLDDSDDNLHDIDTDNLYIEGLVNPYFSNKCLGHEVSIENFVYEFKNKVSPNIVFNETFEDDSAIINSYNIIAFNSDFDDETDIVNTKVAAGEDLSEIYTYKITNETIVDANLATYYYLSNICYRNNFILPNDNGLQNQDYNNFVNYYPNTYSGKFHYNDNNDLDYSFISVNNTFTDNILYDTGFKVEKSCANDLLFNVSNDYYDSLIPLEQRENYLIGGVSTTVFKESYDKFKNISLDNFHNGDFKLSNTYDNQRAIPYRRQNLPEIPLVVGRAYFFNDYSNPASRKIVDNYVNSVGNTLATIGEKEIDNDLTPDTIGYFRHELPFYKLLKDSSECYSTVFAVSTQLFRREIESESVILKDVDLGGTGGALQITLKDNSLGGLYRADCLTKQAVWNSVGHCLYKEGMMTVLHPGLENFGRNNVGITFKCGTQMNVFELNLPAHAGQTNLSRNTSYDKDLRLDDSAFNSDESFVYITDINLHDQDLNIIAKAKLAKPFAKKSLDNVVFRIKMDY